MKIYQTPFIIRLTGAFFFLSGLAFTLVSVLGALLKPETLMTFNFYFLTGLMLLFTFVGLCCWITDVTVINKSTVEFFEAEIFGHKKSVYSREEIKEFFLQDTTVMGRRRPRKAKQLVMILHNGREVLIREPDVEKSLARLLKEVKEFWG